MKILAIDTTTFLGSIALAEDDRLVAAIQQGTEVTYSERLVASIHHLIDGARWDLKDIDLIAVAKGPGSFTGLRIGIGTAKGLAAALKKPLVGASSLMVLGYGAALHDGVVVPIIDARRDEVYAAVYRFKDGELVEELHAEHVAPPDVVGEMLASMEGSLALVGDGARRYEDVFTKRLQNRLVRIDDMRHFPHAGYLAQLARISFQRNGEDDVASLAPNYIRQSDADIGFRGRS